MKVLIESYQRLSGGGIESFLPILANGLHRRGHSVTVIANIRSAREPAQWLDSGIRCVPYPFRRIGDRHKDHSFLWFLDRIPKKLYEFIPHSFLTGESYDLVIALQEGDMMRRAVRERAGRRAAWVHKDYSGPLYRPYRKLFVSDRELRCMRRFERIFCVSQTTRDSIVETVGDPGNLCVRYLPIDVGAIRSRAREDCALRRPKDRPLLVSVCRLIPEKQIDKLLEACELLRRSLDFELWIVGDGPERGRLQAQIERCALDFVRLIGAKENPFPYVAQADLFVSASMTESYGLAVQEALVLGVPVLAIGCRGIRESLDERFGLLVNDSARDLAEGIRALLQTPGLLASRREAIERDYPADSLYEERLDAILDLLEQAPADRPERQG